MERDARKGDPDMSVWGSAEVGAGREGKERECGEEKRKEGREGRL